MNRTAVGLLSASLAAASGLNGAAAAVLSESAGMTDAGQAPIAIDVDAEILGAKSAIAAFATALKTELQNTMKDGGAINAIDACSTRAMEITETVAKKRGLHLSRVALRNRNPANVPTDWQRAVLLDFEARKQAGEDMAVLNWSGVAEVDGAQEFRFMKAIPVSGMCLQCHGSDIDEDVAALIESLYPDDAATGFSPGDIRGAFVVTRTAGRDSP